MNRLFMKFNNNTELENAYLLNYIVDIFAQKPMRNQISEF